MKGIRTDTTPAARSEVVRRAVRVTTAACTGFYTCRYGLHEPVMAVYALFGAISLGILSPIPGSGRQRAAVVLKALPVGWLLAGLGTALAVRTWAAVAGMLTVGFVLAFAAVAGPRPAGAAPGLQLFYILPCFPPYAPEALGDRLAGLSVGVVLLAACERFLLPAAGATPYRRVLADAVALAGRAASGLAAPHPAVPSASADRLRTVGEQLRPSRLPPAERPTAPGRKDRALAQAGSAARRLLYQLEHMGHPPTASEQDVPSSVLLGRVAGVCDETAAALRSGVPPPDSSPETSMRAFQQQRIRQVTGPEARMLRPETLWRQAAVLAAAESARILEAAVRVGIDGRRTRPIPPRELFWYTDVPVPVLWWRRLQGNLTLRSVHFQNAVRTALALGTARLVAGALGLSHGFWVLLAVLTLVRTTAVQTWSSVRAALFGTLAGTVTAGGLLYAAGQHTDAYAALLAPAMLAAFTLGPLLGVAWTQGLFTLVVSAAFAQLAPVTWQLAQVRMVDVVTGSVIGLLCGLLAWPAGARREVQRVMGELLHSLGPVITGTVSFMVTGPPGAPPPSAVPALRFLRLAEAAHAQYLNEPRGPRRPRPDWQAVLATTSHTLVGSQRLPRYDRPGAAGAPDTAAWARSAARQLALAAGRLGDQCAGGRPPPQPPPLPAPPAATATRDPTLPVRIDLEHWLTTLATDLEHIAATVPRGTGREAPDASWE
ncbi:FUSC family protein [Streptomyces sannanensis]|uniref:FUSC family protein n=1 Tax=Streptomyces sannanensis TaxID=285536 RepID=A0ABP6SL20_9ACTN